MSSKREILVGAFVLVGIIATAAVVLTIGNERRVFDPKTEYSTSFPDVQGLKVGAPVRLSGVDIGNVKAISHGPNLTDDRLYVRIEVVRSEATRIREDSVMKIANKGLLGDKMLEITPGTPGRPQLPRGATIKAEDPADFANLLTQVGEITTKTNNTLSNVEKLSATLADEKTREDLQKTLHSVTVVMNNVAQGQGYVGRMLNDPAEADRISKTLNDLGRTTQKLNATLDNLNTIFDRVKTGPGFAHSLVYDTDGNKMMSHFGDAAGEAAIAMRQIREGNGIAKGLLYGGAGQEKLSENLTAMSSDMRAIVRDVRAGKGTIGGLLVDPSIYEDMKSVLGNVQRNDVLRALVRYSIKQDEKKPPVSVEPAK